LPKHQQADTGSSTEPDVRVALKQLIVHVQKGVVEGDTGFISVE
jgi:hypothetical protein